MRAISIPSETAWAILRAGLTVPPAAAPSSGPILLHVGARLRLDAATAGTIARLAPGGPRQLPPGHLVGIARIRSGSIVSAWPLPEVAHLGSAVGFAVDPAALGRHLDAYHAAWATMLADATTDVCPSCGRSCASLCLLGGARLLDRERVRPYG